MSVCLFAILCLFKVGYTLVPLYIFTFSFASSHNFISLYLFLAVWLSIHLSLFLCPHTLSHHVSLHFLITPMHGNSQSSLLWRHNGRDSVSNHQPHDYLLNRLFRRRSKKTSKLRVTGLFARNSPGTGEFPAQMARNAEDLSIWWRFWLSGCLYIYLCFSAPTLYLSSRILYFLITPMHGNSQSFHVETDVIATWHERTWFTLHDGRQIYK